MIMDLDSQIGAKIDILKGWVGSRVGLVPGPTPVLKENGV